MKTIALLFLKLIWITGVFQLSDENLNFSNTSTPTYIDASIIQGKSLFVQHCSTCHGLDGTKGKFGAKNLQKSTLTDEQYLKIILNGKRIMPAWEKKITTGQVSDIITYLKTLKR